MKFFKYLVFLLLISTSCGTPVNEEVSDSGVIDSQDRKKYTEIYDNGQIKIDGWLKEGERDGLWVSFYENGVRWSENEFRNGKKDGKSVTYYPNGIIRYRGHFIEDKEAGNWLFYDEKGKLVREKDFNK